MFQSGQVITKLVGTGLMAGAAFVAVAALVTIGSLVAIGRASFGAFAPLFASRRAEVTPRKRVERSGFAPAFETSSQTSF